MKRKTLYIVCGALLCLATLSCSEEQETGGASFPDVPMSVRMFSRAPMEDGAAAQLFFWDETALKDVDKGAEPFYNCILPGKMSDYNEEPTHFNTDHYYPQLNSRVYALGFSPADMKIVEEGNLGAYYLPKRDGEDITVFASDNIVGSSVYVFHEALEFRPATTRFVFRAICSKNMYDNVYVRNITIKMPPDAVPNVLRWNVKEVCYRADYYPALDRDDNPDGKVVSNPIVYTGSQLSTTDYTELGTRYLALPEEAKALTGITVIAQLSHDMDFPDSGEAVTWWRQWPADHESELSIPLKDLSGNDVKEVKPGQTYLVTITFGNADEFTLTAQEQDWELGETIPVPVLPDEKDKQKTRK